MQHIGPLEMEILGLFEEGGAFSVADIESLLNLRHKQLAYTTIMTILSRLFTKGFLQREKVGRQYRYAIVQKGKKDKESVFKKVASSLFRNARLQPIVALLEESDSLSADELQQLRQLIDKKIAKKKL